MVVDAGLDEITAVSLLSRQLHLDSEGKQQAAGTFTGGWTSPASAKTVASSWTWAASGFRLAVIGRVALRGDGPAGSSMVSTMSRTRRVLGRVHLSIGVVLELAKLHASRDLVNSRATAWSWSPPASSAQ